MVSGVLGTENPNKHLVMISFYTWTVIILVGDIIDNLSLILVKVPKQQGSFQKFFENKYKVMRTLVNSYQQVYSFLLFTCLLFTIFNH